MGAHDDARGEVVVAIVVPSHPERWDEQAVAARVKSTLASYKVPRRWVVVTEEQLPLLPTGKVNRRRLAELLG